ncbi:MAG: hypothetical protein HQL56_05115, partial [Magnetococcales bacterium]|nr:hypothetical protein [Magnetococcales bacterium]
VKLLLSPRQSRGFTFINYLTNEIFIDEAELNREPWTFRKANGGNSIHRTVAPERKLIRLENGYDAATLAGHPLDDLLRAVEEVRGNSPDKAAARTWLERFCSDWNEKRDLRPVFATYLDEVDDLMERPDWADAIRDRLGMAHLQPCLNPATGALEPTPVLLLQYRVEETRLSGERASRLMMPTVLDGELNPCFFPAPIPGAKALEDEGFGGRTVNLSLVSTQNDYSYGMELLHPKMKYKVEHLIRTGVVSRAPGLSLEQARQWHLPMLRVFRDRDDFLWRDRDSP